MGPQRRVNGKQLYDGEVQMKSKKEPTLRVPLETVCGRQKSWAWVSADR